MSDTNLEKFRGCWKLVSSEFKSSDGNVFQPYGEDPVGMSINDGKGHFSAQIMRRDRPKFEADPEDPEVLKAAYQGYLAYFGTTEVDEEKKMRTNHVEGALNPNWVGGDQIRYFEFSDGRLIFRTAPIKIGEFEVTGTLAWERIS